MTKKGFGLILAALLLFSLLAPGLSLAQDRISLLESTVAFEFPTSLTFKMEAESATEITKVRLNYRVDKMSYAPVISEAWPLFTPGSKIEATWIWDMRKANLPPGAIVEYWWVIEDAAKHRLETAPALVRFDDNRYPWRSLTTGDITLFWYRGDELFAQELMSAAQQALRRLTDDIGARLERPAEIYIYASSEALLGAMIYKAGWEGGVAMPEYGVIAIGIAPDADSLAWGKRALAHELAHQVVHQATFGAYGDLPTWLDEGLAVYAEGEISPHHKSQLERAISEGRLLSARSLSSPFSAHPEQAFLSYAQSYSLVEFLINSYGKDKMLRLLSVFQQGSGYDEALTQVYGFDMDELNALWRATTGIKTNPVEGEAQPVWGKVLAGLAALGALLLLARLALAYKGRRS